MASLNGQTIASSYEQLLHTDTDGGGNGNTLVSIKDGDNGTTFGLKLATNKVEIIPGSDDANAFEVSQADGTAVFTVNSSTPSATLAGTLTATKALSSDTQTTPETILTLGAKYSSTGADGGAGSGSRIEFQIPDDGTNPKTGTAIAGIKESADDSDSSAGMAFYVSQNDTTLDEVVRIDHDGNLLVGKTSGTSGNLIETDGRISAGAGSSGQPTFNCEGDTNTGINLPESDRIQFITGGSERMRIDSSGNVGIGTGSPAEMLEIYNATAPAIQLNDGGDYQAIMRLAGNDLEIRGSGGKLELYNGANDGDSSTLAMTIDSSQRVGIGTASPNTPLQIAYSNASGTDYLDGDAGLYLANSGSDGTMIKFGDTNAGLVYGSSGSGTFKLMQRENTAVFIDASRNVGIGESSPLGNLHVKSADSGASAHASADELVIEGSANSGINILSGNSSEGGIYFGDDGDNDAGRVRYDHNNNSLDFFTSGHEKMNVSGAGLTITEGYPIYAGRASTDGGRILAGHYNLAGGDVLGVLSSQYSSGGFIVGYGVEGKEGASGYVSTNDAFSGVRTAMQLDTDGVQFLTSSATQASPGTDITTKAFQLLLLVFFVLQYTHLNFLQSLQVCLYLF
jgi:hypothetical protein